MPPLKADERRKAILQEVFELRPLRRGTVNEQFLKSVDASGNDRLRGPYFVESRREGAKTVSRRIPHGPELERAQAAVKNYKRYSALMAEFENLTEQLDEQAARQDSKKKVFKPNKPKRSTSK